MKRKMKNYTAFTEDYPNKKHPFKIDKTLNLLNKERKNKTTLNHTNENVFKRKFKRNMPIEGDIHR